jgi:hypothetical protein
MENLSNEKFSQTYRHLKTAEKVLKAEWLYQLHEIER